MRFVTYDHAGHGASEGVFERCTVSDWRADLAAVIADAGICGTGPLIIVGSSMGLHLSLLAVADLAQQPAARRIAAIIGVGGSINFTMRLAFEMPSDAGEVWMRPSRYDPNGYPIARALLDDGAANLISPGWRVPCPVELIHGMQDLDVPWPEAFDAAALIDPRGPDGQELVVEFTLVPDGDHRLSSPDHLNAISEAIKDARQTIPA
ncbi:hypothetical protein HK105_201287 [Polyrhizophydium stewartii]|uniref:AB hydrolase-1 domain-containing protein n=1 Tax=Polyrhizophydium stewartii TaxID=2732419 RepID=A0ABR4NHN2_9FUNG|nr:hypothetical protein HK105_007684 [Polyrhizophydium stewartii]